MQSALRQAASQLIGSAILRLHLYYRIAKFARKGRFACYNPLRMRYSLQAGRERFDLAVLSGCVGVSPGTFPNNRIRKLVPVKVFEGAKYGLIAQMKAGATKRQSLSGFEPAPEND